MKSVSFAFGIRGGFPFPAVLHCVFLPAGSIPVPLRADEGEGGAIGTGIKGVHVEVLADGKDAGDGGNAKDKVRAGLAAEHQMPGDCKEQNLEGGTRGVLDQHADELDADDQVESVLEKDVEGVVVVIGEELRHLPDQRDDGEEEADEHDDGNGNLHDLGHELQVVRQRTILLFPLLDAVLPLLHFCFLQCFPL